MEPIYLSLSRLALVVVAGILTSAHGGGLDSYGCHHDRKRGGYHCHQGPLAGRSFMTKDEAIHALPTSPSRIQDAIQGVASVIDGDTIEIHGIKIRLYGIDAPESNQTCRAEGVYPCGQQAALALSSKVGRQIVVCEKKGKDRYGRIVAVCRLNGEDLNSWLVSQGHALAYRRYSDVYVRDEEVARQSNKGIWQGEFVPPWLWRQGSR